MSTVWIENHQGRLRLVWNHQGKRQTLAVGMDDNPTGRAIAQKKAHEIQLDLMTGHYDSTKLKYRPRLLGRNPTEISAPELFAKWTAYIYTEKELAPRSVETRYKPLESSLKQHLDFPASKVTESKARDFAAICAESLSPGTAKARLWLLQSCWEWAQDKYHVEAQNPWRGLAAKVKNRPSKAMKPFTETELRAILAGFKSDRYYSFYYPVVKFLIQSAVRPGEAFGLRWGSVSRDFSSVSIRESVSRGYRRSGTKTGKSRTVFLTSAIAEMMKTMPRGKADDLVFPSPKGKEIHDSLFSKRAWRAVLNAAGIEHRPVYCIRHSSISHAIAAGANPVELCEQTGHSKATMLSVYAHAINARSLFVEFE
jgi:integrase